MSGHLWLQKLGIPQFAIPKGGRGRPGDNEACLSGCLHALFPLPGTLSTWLGPSSLLLVCSLGITVFWRFPWPLPAFPSLGSCFSRAFPGGLCPPLTALLVLPHGRQGAAVSLTPMLDWEFREDRGHAWLVHSCLPRAQHQLCPKAVRSGRVRGGGE